ncbi:iron-containing alcohol dehydrogenase [Pseudomonas sp. GD04087]|uniref:iron-containing alcohol dehydrogenase family protein n=1 Tax=unclassified Pseudomonas TaxID=196821 RepID=UPI002446A39A|nr:MULTISPECIES: iron-containing alcohol dehydrogenase [unclassified Pseudomonas]MDH0292096.1 iron-containing alcohol dehydrogenase [Pseudomonas sp. GD04087]MDH1049186.1 iron-containing alcohol dehydrogenase [Pseudomonas sp. GD03903]MDH1999674.1 iron-containing alcohol dehydrogenase [Pseudomonas sp. GD03691]
MNAQDVGRVIYRALDMLNARAVREFRVPPSTYIGSGAIVRASEAIQACGISRVFVMVDGLLHEHGLDQGLLRSLEDAGVVCEYLIYPGGEPHSETVEAASRQLLAAHCDGVLAFGGGSVLDAAKVTAMLAANPGHDLGSLGQDGRAVRRRVPLIAVPTTAGTGSEATNVAVITDSLRQVKQVLVHSDLIPDLAIIDACLTVGVPPGVTATTGIDALTHAIEAYVSPTATPLTQGLALRAVALIGEALPLAVGQGGNIAARESMMLASYMAGMAFANSGLGLCHATAHPLGARYGIPHGQANALMLPAVMRFNQLVCKRAYGEIGHALTRDTLDSEASIAAVQQLIDEVGAGRALASFGVLREDFAALAEVALQDLCLAGNPRSASAPQIIGIYQDAWQR